MIVAHQGGWDETLLVVGPLAFIYWLLRLAKRRAAGLAAMAPGPPPYEFDEVHSREEQREVLRQLLGTAPWCAGTLTYVDGTLTVGGWALPVIGSDAPGEITVNGRPMRADSWGTPRPDIEHLFWEWPDAAATGFEVSLAIAAEDLFAEGHLVLDYTHGTPAQVINPNHRMYFPGPRRSNEPLPDHARQARVQGMGDDTVFALEGYSAFTKIVSTIERHTGRRRDHLGPLLDWGCGCGRLTRYFTGMRGTKVTGVDIDADNVAWCSANLSFGRYFAVPTTPPCSQLGDKEFRIVIGMSVMTHLTEVDQRAWLTELARVTKRGAIVALTVHGGATVARSDMEMELLNQWLRVGFLDGGMNPDLVTSIDEPSFYRNSFHSPAYIAANWTEHFTVQQHIESFVGNHHDLVVLRRR
ncbi:MAG TPA: class I SAM-dependent methyltransferase [Ilumatobacteraceae bacterium]